MNTLYYGDNLNILRRYGGNPHGSKGVPVTHASTDAADGDTLPTGRVSAFVDNVLFKDESDSKPTRYSTFPLTHGIGKARPRPTTISSRATRFPKCSRPFAPSSAKTR